MDFIFCSFSEGVHQFWKLSGGGSRVSCTGSLCPKKGLCDFFFICISFLPLAFCSKTPKIVEYQWRKCMSLPLIIHFSGNVWASPYLIC